jgi:hypothetical protein
MLPPKRKEKRGETKFESQRQCLTKAQLEDHLSAFKTKECGNDDMHDPRICHQFHDHDRDRRRTPKKTTTRSMNAPIPWKRYITLPSFEQVTISLAGLEFSFQSMCAHAHSAEDLGDRRRSEREYEDRPSEKAREQRILAAFVPDHKPRDFVTERRALWYQVC